MNVVVDTNVYIDAIFNSDDYALKVLRKEYAGEIAFVMNQKMYIELLAAFMAHSIAVGQPKGVLYKYSNKLANAIWRVGKVEHITCCDICKDDVHDNKFIDCAIDAKAKYIITSNGAHLFNLEDEILKQYKHEVKILSPFQFINELNMIRLMNETNKKGSRGSQRTTLFLF